MYVGLGQTIPWQCWEAPGFKGCHAVQWQAAADLCRHTKPGDQAYEGDVSRCVEEQTYRLTRDACFSLCQPSDPETLPTPMTEEEIEEAGGRPKSRVPWGAIAVYGGFVAVGLLLLGGVTMGRDYERKRATA